MDQGQTMGCIFICLETLCVCVRGSGVDKGRDFVQREAWAGIKDGVSC